MKNFSLRGLRKFPQNLKKKPYFQTWLPKTARAFGLAAVPGSNEERVSRTKTYGEVADAAMRQEGWRSLGFAQSRLARPKVSRGDTIVEVMISMSILAVVLSGAYATSHRSLQSGLNSQYQDQALSHARAQIELIKNADNNQPASVGSYKLNRPFCINPTTTAVQEVDSSSKACPLPIGQTDPNNQLPYTIVNNYDSTSKSFTSTVSWLSSNGVPSTVTLRYKAHDSFVTTSSSFPPPTSPGITPPPAVGVSLSANPTSVAYGGTSQLAWSSTGATDCTASGAWNGPRPTTGPPGGEAVGPLNSINNVFYLACTNGGATTQKQVTVTASVPPAPSLNFSPDSPTVAPGASTTLRWTTSNVPGTCSASDGWSGTRDSSGNVPTGPISTTTNYTLTCNGNPGTTPVSKTVTVQVTVLSVKLNASSNSIRNHSPLTLSWSSVGASSCTASSSWNGSKAVSGSETINPTNLSLSGNNQSFYLTCYGAGGSVTDRQTVYVGESGLLAHYYQGSNFESFQGTYGEPTVWYAWSSNYGSIGGWPDLLRSRANNSYCNHCSVYWSGFIYTDTPGYYYFGMIHDDGMGIYIGDFGWVTSYWGTTTTRWDQSGAYYMDTGWHYIQINWQNDYVTEWEEVARTYWYGPWGYWSQIPQSNLSPT